MVSIPAPSEGVLTEYIDYIYKVSTLTKITLTESEHALIPRKDVTYGALFYLLANGRHRLKECLNSKHILPYTCLSLILCAQVSGCAQVCYGFVCMETKNRTQVYQCRLYCLYSSMLLCTPL